MTHLFSKGFLGAEFYLGFDGPTDAKPVLLRSGLALVVMGVASMT
jgi:hypothetical protein